MKLFYYIDIQNLIDNKFHYKCYKLENKNPGIQVIKMYAWEYPFHKIVAEARRLEIKQIRFASYIRGVNMSSFVFIESK